MRNKIQRGDGKSEVIRTIAPGAKITQPGVYRLSMEQYHGDVCDGPSISSSGLRKIRTHSPKHYWYTSALNPDRTDDDDISEREAVRIGRAAHTLMLEPETFRKLFVTRPGAFDSWRTKEAKQWRLDAQADGFTVMDPDEMQRVVGIAKALETHPLTKAGLIGGDIELSIVWKDQKTGIWLKSRPDAIPIGSNILADIKCVRDARNDEFSKAAFDAGYDMQLALAGIGMQEVLGREVEDYVLVACESKEPHAIRIAPIAEHEIDRARLLLRWSINKFAKCWKEKSWPAFDEDDNLSISRPKYKADVIERQIKDGLLPERF